MSQLQMSLLTVTHVEKRVSIIFLSLYIQLEIGMKREMISSCLEEYIL